MSFPAGHHTGVEAPLAHCAAMRAKVHDSQQVPLDNASRTSPINIDAAAVRTSAVNSLSHTLHRSTSLAVLIDRRTGKSNPESLVDVLMKFCSDLRSREIEIFRTTRRPSDRFLSSERPNKWRNLLGFRVHPYSELPRQLRYPSYCYTVPG